MSNLLQSNNKIKKRYYVALFRNQKIVQSIFVDLPEQTENLLFFVCTTHEIKFSQWNEVTHVCNIVESDFKDKDCVINLLTNITIDDIVETLFKYGIVYLDNSEYKTNYLKILNQLKETFEKKWRQQ